MVLSELSPFELTGCLALGKTLPSLRFLTALLSALPFWGKNRIPNNLNVMLLPRTVLSVANIQPVGDIRYSGRKPFGAERVCCRVPSASSGSSPRSELPAQQKRTKDRHPHCCVTSCRHQSPVTHISCSTCALSCSLLAKEGIVFGVIM